MSLRRAVLTLVLSLLVPLTTASAEEEASSYTPAELDAIDRALHAVNCVREDLQFDRDMAKGHACMAPVRRMLRQPLDVARWIDGYARTTRSALAEASLAAIVREARASWRDPGVPLEIAVEPTTWLDDAMPRSPDELVALFREQIQAGVPFVAGTSAAASLFADPRLRLAFPPAMAWHDVFDSPYDEAETARLEKEIETLDDAWLHERAVRIDLDRLVEAWQRVCLEPRAWQDLPPAAFPTDQPLVVETEQGRIAIGTLGDDVYEGEYAVLIDPGGNDRYLNCRIGAADGARDRAIGLFVDLGGDDVYACGDTNFTLGAAILGVAAFYDLGAGNDRYEGGHATLGAAMGGIAVFYDDGGADTYAGKTFTQGAAGFGLGLHLDASTQAAPATTPDEGTPDPVEIGLFDNDMYKAWANAQAFARCRGIALCINERGNEVYHAGGVYLHAPLFKDRYQSFSQGFAIGQRNIDYAGGIALLADYAGNDRYLGDIYNQGVGYWYAAGLLYDGGGNDVYEMTQYGQGSGIHLAVGGLVDEGGNDTYVMHAGLGQGGSHDYAVSILHDRGGNDRYLGSTSCNGSGLTNSVGLHIDRAGDDVYAGRKKGGVNFGRPARGFSSLGLLIDLGGNDDYLGLMDGEGAWRHADMGVGLDLEPPPPADEPAPASTVAETDEAAPELPAVCSHVGELTDEVFAELWAISRRWEVGENRRIVPKARARLIAAGPAVLDRLDARVESDRGGLDARAFAAVLGGLAEAGARDEVLAFVRSNAGRESEARRRFALFIIGDLKLQDLEDIAAGFLASEDPAIRRRAAGVLLALSSHAGDAALRTWLSEDADAQDIQAALPVLLTGGGSAYAYARPLLDDPRFRVRTTLATLLARHTALYQTSLQGDLVASDLTPRARRTVLDALARAKEPPTHELLVLTLPHLDDADWGLRADAARLLRHWSLLESTPPALAAEARQALDRRMKAEDDPYVRFSARSAR